MKKIIFVFVSMLCVLTSCNLADDDGVWDPMELRASTEMDASRNIKVPSTGATIQVIIKHFGWKVFLRMATRFHKRN